MIHGYSGSPGELRPMGAALAAAGSTVLGPLLSGHGGAPDDLFGVRWEEWYAGVEAGLRRLQERCRQVFACGFSVIYRSG